jgi:hypothetical protein
MSKTYGFLLEFIPMEIGAGMTFLEVALRAICDVRAPNKHASLLKGRKSLYPKVKQYLRSIYVRRVVESEKFTPVRERQQIGW